MVEKRRRIYEGFTMVLEDGKLRAVPMLAHSSALVPADDHILVPYHNERAGGARPRRDLDRRHGGTHLP